MNYRPSDHKPLNQGESFTAGAVEKWRKLLGPTDSHAARLEAPLSVRAIFGSDKTRNACHGSDSSENATAECDFFFSSQVPTAASSF